MGPLPKGAKLAPQILNGTPEPVTNCWLSRTLATVTLTTIEVAAKPQLRVTESLGYHSQIISNRIPVSFHGLWRTFTPARTRYLTPPKAPVHPAVSRIAPLRRRKPFEFRRISRRKPLELKDSGHAIGFTEQVGGRGAGSGAEAFLNASVAAGSLAVTSWRGASSCHPIPSASAGVITSGSSEVMAQAVDFIRSRPALADHLPQRRLERHLASV